MLIGIWVSKKIMFSPNSIMKMADSVLEYAINTKEGQDKLKFVADYLGKNVAGSAMGSVKQSLPKTKDILPIILLSLAQRYIPGLAGVIAPQNEQEQSKPALEQQSAPKW